MYIFLHVYILHGLEGMCASNRIHCRDWNDIRDIPIPTEQPMTQLVWGSPRLASMISKMATQNSF